jgi:hypothetical protein
MAREARTPETTARRLRSMGTDLGKTGGLLIEGLMDANADWQKWAEEAQSALEVERSAHRGTLAEYDKAQKRIEELQAALDASEAAHDSLKCADPE